MEPNDARRLYRDRGSGLLRVREDPDEDYSMSPGGIWVRGRDRIQAKPTAVDLFCGCGGFSLGFINSGFEVVCAVENDAWASVTYLANLGQWPMQIHFVTPDDKARLKKTLQRAQKKHKKVFLDDDGEEVVASCAEDEDKVASVGFPVCGEYRPREQTPVRSFIFGDIKQVTGDLIRRVAGIERLDAVMGGPPCQGFSTANSKAGPDDARNPLVFEFARLIVELNPATFAMENVPQIAKMRTPDGIKVLDQFDAILRSGGYSTYDGLEKLRKAMPQATIVHRHRDPKRGSPTPERKKAERKKKPAKTPAPTPLFDGADE